ncbi:lysophospholipase L1-like esterase [Dysgonomonas sp. PFB1-18]|uniref:rhamnogalacturonan acetylesterase n=1 Tax=unclassified Dysgonomonas TaxID=2630389 RepID=UPI002476EF6A|nr:MULTISPECIES: rhamnogalacturonan acetylesterase [unclassified Dysgonomonas]MDH6307957.1 lysophospholipase L1-like esterase [Dysgonomonas sp. PF1-14]MDH6339496.1 lysophospholipase L1-like esterase [Dysgonomonas sp. PF1-16]MDH6381147.1 lysophospholipase L1-like esterase [Dysgonomonas sp. PFB1-18]MDH6398359.1 lysophospholipase L1-like esterase [Dysgonomonas sp. PF1-23]
MRRLLLTILLCLTVSNLSSFAQKRIFMIGDSTMADKDLFKDVTDSISGTTESVSFPEKGWGQLLPLFFNENIVIENHAKNGRSSKSFIKEGRWQKVIDNIGAGDYLIIQFGHNDASKDKKDRYTTPEEYVEYFTMFVQKAKEIGAKPIICTSVARRKFNKNGLFEDSHGEYLDLARNVAKKEAVPMIDMYEKSKKLLLEMGEENSKSLFLHLKPGDNKNFPNGKIDNTHFNVKGANAMAELFIEGLKEKNLEDLTKEFKTIRE